jgi:dTDP-4-amino-4,6-dideoxygalactose transaminase
MDYRIPFNKPFLSGNELSYMKQAIEKGHISGDGYFTQKCQSYFKKSYSFGKSLLTTSCTAALEMAAILCEFQPGDEVIMPSYTFVSTANAFLIHGATIRFADSAVESPHIDPIQIKELITHKTKALVVVHYGGVACQMDEIMELVREYNLILIEDAAQAINSFYYDRPIGAFGHFATLSFHETKNVISGEGGLLIINDEKYFERVEIIREKGTNRSAFFRGEISKYEWVDIGSSFLPSDMIAAFLYAQLENIDTIQKKRVFLWNRYQKGLSEIVKKAGVKLPAIPPTCRHNAHIFYLVCNDNRERNNLINYLKQKGILAVFHYLPLHLSPFFHNKHDGRLLPRSVSFSERLIRLPMFFELQDNWQDIVIEEVVNFFKKE